MCRRLACLAAIFNMCVGQPAGGSAENAPERSGGPCGLCENACRRVRREREEPLTSPRGSGEKRAARSGLDGRESAGSKILAGPGSGRPSRLFLGCCARRARYAAAQRVRGLPTVAGRVGTSEEHMEDWEAGASGVGRMVNLSEVSTQHADMGVSL
ncbi:hypothetical protein C8T65DRAFT_270587 [Cerioporus squamosus]|nr:hypothetical protein C8T65DRAFT_270587 [Cerioporus squamosus]